MDSFDGQGAGPLEKLPASPQGIGFIASRFTAPDWATGRISDGDARFLFELMTRENPHRMVELGVTSGTSTTFLLKVLASLGAGGRLCSFDFDDRYYADPGIRLGQFIFDELGPAPADFALFPKVNADHVAERFAASGGGEADLAFIDAGHEHPLPCLDLLALLPVLQPGAWVALHDISLPFIHARFPCYGPHHLFRQWPGGRRVLDDASERPNIGAIRLPQSRADAIDAVLAVLATPWDRAGAVAALTRYAAARRNVGPAGRARLNAIYRREAGLVMRRALTPTATIRFIRWLPRRIARALRGRLPARR